ncbi:hypothetical protein DYBT9623_01979 [Dyadobacter sp. CECT 9623]|uniref:Uncharacterized protein n=2 Tax=Dyadobacter linearis TaxID=2823330 RepID=A0ABN7RCQ0_9BACT|nr:hypothetical protein DYBT9623_01979 [Dyadobacter sp. CECT 9623]
MPDLSQMLHAMTGKEIFDRYQLIALAKGLGSQEFHYGNILYQALRIEGEERLFEMLELAENTGKRIALSYSASPDDNQYEPDTAVLI